MEYNSVDKVFADKLRDIEKTPSTDIWNRLQERQDINYDRSSFQYARVACVAVLFMFGTLAWQPLRDRSQTPNGQQQLVAFYSVKQQMPRALGSETANFPVGKEAPSNHIDSPGIATNQRVTHLDIAQSKVDQQESVLAINAPSTISTSKEEPFKQSSDEALVIVVQIADAPVAVSDEVEASTMEASPKKKTKTNKLFQQLRKIKDGEKVNWKELGISSESVLALVRDDTHRRPTNEK